MSDKITFAGANGDALAASLDAPEHPKAYVLFAHCFTCNKELNTINRISKALNAEGIALFRFDFTGLGASHGDFANTNFSSNVDDLLAAADFMRENYKAPAIMMGHSFGGTATLVAASKVPEVKAVATIGAPADTEHVAENFAEEVACIEAYGQADVKLAGRIFTIKKQFLDDIKQQTIQAHIAKLDRALLIMHSPTDDTVGIENARVIFDAAKHPKSFISLDGADHLLMQHVADGEYVAKILSAWASRYVDGI